MQYRTLGSSGLLVSPLCLGTMTFGRPVEEPEAIKLVHGAIDLGINFVDTANIYEGYSRVVGSPGGISEEILGKALKTHRHEVILTTKVGAPIGPGHQDRGLSATHILREIDHSLRRLQTDYVDIYTIHWPDQHTPLETTLRALESLVEQGKVRYIGASNHTAEGLCEMLWLADKLGMPSVVVSQIPFSLLRREFQHDLGFCKRHKIGVTPYQSLQGGLLTGKYRRGKPLPKASRAAEKPEWMWNLDNKLFNKLEGIEALAREAGVSTTQYVLSWTLSQPAITSLILGVKDMAQIEEAVASLQVKLPLGHAVRLDKIFPAPWKQHDPIRGN